MTALEELTALRGRIRREAKQVRYEVLAEMDEYASFEFKSPPTRRKAARGLIVFAGGEFDDFYGLDQREQARIRAQHCKPRFKTTLEQVMSAMAATTDFADESAAWVWWLHRSRTYSLTGAVLANKPFTRAVGRGSDLNLAAPDVATEFDVNALLGDDELALDYLAQRTEDHAQRAAEHGTLVADLEMKNLEAQFDTGPSPVHDLLLAEWSAAVELCLNDLANPDSERLLKALAPPSVVASSGGPLVSAVTYWRVCGLSARASGHTEYACQADRMYRKALHENPW